ncbi:MAG: hypothetical protein AAGC85_20160 [Bacteroidota bacterium]
MISSKLSAQSPSVSVEASLILEPASTQTQFLHTQKMLALSAGLQLSTQKWTHSLLLRIINQQGQILFQRKLSREECNTGGKGIRLNAEQKRLAVSMGEVAITEVDKLRLEVCFYNPDSERYDCSER